MERADTEEAERRAELVVDIQSRIMDEWNEEMQGEVVEVLCEGFDGQSMSYVGRSRAESPDIDGQFRFPLSRQAGDQACAQYHPRNFLPQGVQQIFDIRLVPPAVHLFQDAVVAVLQC